MEPSTTPTSTVSDSNNLTSSELAVLDSLHDSPQAKSQRDIARQTGLSVGLINAVIKRLVLTGYVKTSHLNRRSIEYLLTPEGFAEKARKSYRYIMRTVRTYHAIQVRLDDLLDKLVSEGVREFYLNGDGELAKLVETFFEEGGHGILKSGLPKGTQRKAVVLNVEPGALEEPNGWRVVELTSELDVPEAMSSKVKGTTKNSSKLKGERDNKKQLKGERKIL